MRISDWSSDVCSSDLPLEAPHSVELTLEVDRHRLVFTLGRGIAELIGGQRNRIEAAVEGEGRRDRDALARIEERILRGAEKVAAAAIDDAVRRAIGQDTLIDRGILERRVELAIGAVDADLPRSEEHTSELQSLMRISYAVFRLKQKI